MVLLAWVRMGVMGQTRVDVVLDVAVVRLALEWLVSQGVVGWQMVRVVREVTVMG